MFPRRNRSGRPTLGGAVIAYVFYAVSLISASVGLWVLGAREYEARLESLRHDAIDVTANVAMLIATCIDHVDLLRRQAETLLAEPTQPDSAHRAMASLAPSTAFAGFALDSLPAGADPNMYANLTGAGTVPTADSDAGREMLMALALDPLLEGTHDQVPDAAWVYYTSKSRFILLHPWVPSHEFHWSDDLLGYEFYTRGLPEHDAMRVHFWTDVYLDLAGKGLMATIGQPVYDAGGRFRGTIDIDLTLGTLSRLMAAAQAEDARVFLANTANHVIADSAAAGVAPTKVADFADLLPSAPALRRSALALDHPATEFESRGGWLLYRATVTGTPWRLVMIVDRRRLVLDAAASIWIGFVGLALLIIALLAIEQRRRAAGALAENVEALQHMTLDIAAARDEAQQANKAKSMLLANVSHELRTPLNAIIGFSDLMRHEMFGPLGHPKYQGYAGDIQKSGSLLLSLINDLLDATKLEAGRYELTEAACDLGAILREAIALVKVQAEQGGVTLDVTISDTLPPVIADERGLRQIALNLLSNAVKFTPEGGRVSVACRLDELGRPVLTVADTGRGIPEEEIPDLFQPFARAEAAKRAGTPGTGLGLVIVKSLVELHQGKIALESRVGIGTTVTVTLPRERVIAAPDTRSNVAHPHKADAI